MIVIVFFTLSYSLFIWNRSEMLLSSLLIFFDISSIFMFLADAEFLDKHRGLIKFVSSAYDIVLKLELASWISFI